LRITDFNGSSRSLPCPPGIIAESGNGYGKNPGPSLQQRLYLKSLITVTVALREHLFVKLTVIECFERCQIIDVLLHKIGKFVQQFSTN
jgi:hypothetical protein